MISKLKKWAALEPKQRRLWLKAAFVLIVIGIMLRILSFNRFKNWYHHFSMRTRPKSLTDQDISDVVWAVESAANKIPMKLLCLPQALAVKYLLGKTQGIVMHIGFNKDVSQKFEFHAWVEKQGQTIIGNLPTHYQPLWVWD